MESNSQVSLTIGIKLRESIDDGVKLKAFIGTLKSDSEASFKESKHSSVIYSAESDSSMLLTPLKDNFWPTAMLLKPTFISSGVVTVFWTR
jgi:hypothetical protein